MLAGTPSCKIADPIRALRDVWNCSDHHAAAKLHARGKLRVEEKLSLLFDSETFVETMVPSVTLDARHGERRLRTGYGRMQGWPVAAAIFDASIAAGAITVSTGAKLIEHMQLAEAQRCPLVIDWDSGGADINDGVSSLNTVRRIFTQINELSGRIPTLSIASGLNAGAGAYAPVMTDTVIMIDGSMMAVTGPAVTKVATGETVTPEEMGGSQLHTEQSGEAHYRVSDYAAAARLARCYLSYFPQSMWSFPRRTPPAHNGRETVNLRVIITQARHNAARKRQGGWDVRAFIEVAVDEASWLEYHEHYAPSVVVGFARIAGIAVAVIANQRQVLAGSLTAAASAKVTRFLRLANAYHLPVVTFVDVPGFIATQAESAGQILSKGASLLMMYPNVMVPRVSVVIDKAFGGAYCAMDCLDTSVRSPFSKTYGFTTGQVAVMGKEAGPFFTYGSAGGNPELQAQYQERYEREYLNMELAFSGQFVEPLEPEHLRQCLVEDIPHLYAQYRAYWQKLMHEVEQVQAHCPHLFAELRHGTVRGLIHPL